MWDRIDRSLLVMRTGLDGSALRQKVLSNNLANIDTPNYKERDVNFYDTLKNMVSEDTPSITSSLALTKTNAAHIDGKVKTSGSYAGFDVKESDGMVRPDGNNVNIDVESAKVAENNIYYGTLATVVAKKYKMMERAITKGGEQ